MRFKYLYIIILILALIPFVSATAPVAGFSVSPTSGSTPLYTSFTDSSSNTPTGWAWFFGDEQYNQAWASQNTSGSWMTRSNHNTVLLQDGTIVLFGGTNGTRQGDVWNSTDNGLTWTLVNGTTSGWGLRYSMSSVVLANGDIILTGGATTTQLNDTWKSSDRGNSWTRPNATNAPWAARYSHSSVVLPDNSIVLIGGYSTKTLNDTWRSTDGGVSWVQQNASAPFAARAGFSSIVLNGNIIIMGGFNVTSTVRYNDVWKSLDQGVTWTQINASAGWAGRNYAPTVLMPDGSIVITGGALSGSANTNSTWRSTDGGVTWTNITGSPGWAARSGPSSVVSKNGGIIMTGGSGPAYKNDTWMLYPVGSSSQNPTHTYSSAGNYTLALQAYNADGYNNTIKLNYINVSNPYARFSANITSGTAPLPVAFTDSSTGYPSTWTWTFGDENYNQPWTEPNASMGWLQNSRLLYSTAVLPDGSIVFMGGYNQAAPTQAYNDTWRSTDNGATWTLINSSSGWSARGGQVTVSTQNGTIVLMGGGPQNDVMDNQVWASTDKGYTWKMINASAGWLKRYNGGAVILPDNSIVLLLGYGGYAFRDDVWRSTDSGVTWIQQNSTTGMAAYWFSTAVTQSGNILVLGGNGATVRNTVYKSTDKGVTWTNISMITPTFSPRYGHTSTTLADGSILLMGGYTNVGYYYLNDTYRSTDEGATWTQTNISGGALWEQRRNSVSNTMPDGSVLLIGGYGGTTSTYYNDTYRFVATGSSSQSPTHTYTGNGNYTVSLTIFNSTTGSNTTTIIGYINVSAPSGTASDFTSNITEKSSYPMVVQFNDTSTGSPSTWNWSFGDGRWFNTTNSALRNATYTYAVANKYTVNLTTNNTVGTNTVSKSQYINLTSDNDASLTSWLHMNGTNGSTIFNGEKGVAWLTNGNAYISTNQPKYGGASGRFSGANAYISSLNSSAFSFGTGDFTIEFWVNVTSVTGTNIHMFSKTNNPRNQGWGLDRTDSALGDSGWDFWMGNDSAGQVFFNAPILNHTWTFITVERRSGTIYLYVNGNLTNSSAGFNANYDTSDPVWIGRQQSNYFNGYIDEFRISNNVSRWKSNFTPPFNEYRGTLYTSYPDVNPASTFRYKTDPTGVAYVDNITPRNRTLQIENITNTSYVVGGLLFDTDEGYVKSVQLNLSTYPTGMTLISSSIDNVAGIIEFNISKPTGFNNGTSRASILDYTLAYVRYDNDTADPNPEYFAYGYLINGTTGYSYPVHNFLGTPVTYGPWNFTANFTTNVTTGHIGDTIQFVSTFNGSYPTRWNWSFGDGTYNDGYNSIITHAYSTGGLYTVSLQEYLEQNSSINNTITKTNYITIGDPLIANFIISNQTGASPLVSHFTDTSTNSPIAWNWSFGDGSYSSTQNPTHTFTGVNNYTIILNATNLIGSNSTTKYVNVSYPPVTNFTMNTSKGSVPLAIQFTDDSGYGPTIAWNWSFGDGSSFVYTQNPIHTYNVIGLYNVTLISTNLFGSNSTTHQVIAGDPPVANFTISNQTGLYQLIVRLNDTSTNNPTAWNWSVDYSCWTETQNPVYALTGYGNYTIMLIATNFAGSTCVTHYANVSNETALPITNFTMNNSIGASPLAIQFTDNSGGSNPIIAWNWSFGDLPGNYSDIQNPVHTFTEFGLHNVTLYTANIFGTNITCKSVFVIIPPIASFTMSNTTSNAPLVVQFNDTSLYLPTTWNWSFGEGNYSSIQNATYVYTEIGNFTVTLTASNFAGSNSTSQHANSSNNLPPIASFTMSNITGGSPLVVRFTDTSVNSPNTWNWSFGDGNYSDIQNPAYIFTSVNNYTITLNISNYIGNDTTKHYAEVFGMPIANFTTDTQEGYAPLPVNFTDTSLGGPTSWNWSFNNKTGNNTYVLFSTLEYPSYTFGIGNFTIKLNVSNPSGSNISPTEYWINVSVAVPPIADFSSTSTGGPYPPLNVQFNDTSSNYPNQWNWSFGDGNVSASQDPLHVYTFCGNFSVLLRVENAAGVSWKNTTNYITLPCAPPPPSPDQRIATRMADIGNFVVIAAIILVIALVATFIYMWAKRRS